MLFFAKYWDAVLLVLLVLFFWSTFYEKVFEKMVWIMILMLGLLGFIGVLTDDYREFTVQKSETLKLASPPINQGENAYALIFVKEGKVLNKSFNGIPVIDNSLNKGTVQIDYLENKIGQTREVVKEVRVSEEFLLGSSLQ